MQRQVLEVAEPRPTSSPRGPKLIGFAKVSAEDCRRSERHIPGTPVRRERWRFSVSGIGAGERKAREQR